MNNRDEFTSKQCKACQVPAEPLKGEALEKLRQQLGGDWQIIDEHHLEKQYKFKNFRQALDFVNRIGDMAEEQGHHPDVYLSWGKVQLVVWTHKIGGLTEGDFVYAAKADGLY